MITMDAFIAEHGIKSTVRNADGNPNMLDSSMFHYKVTLRYDGKQLTTHFSTGNGWTTEPTTRDVLECLALDAAGIENARSFEEWCSEYGYDEDSRTAERTYKACERQTEKLRRLMGDLYETLLWEVEN